MNRLLILLALAAFTAHIEFTVGTSDPIYLYYYQIKLAKEGFDGKIIELTLVSDLRNDFTLGRIFPEVLTCPKGEISAYTSPFQYHKGSRSEYKDPVENAASLKLFWGSGTGSMNVDYVIVMRVKKGGSNGAFILLQSEEMIQGSKAFCGDGQSISANEPRTLKDCTSDKLVEIKELANNLPPTL